MASSDYSVKMPRLLKNQETGMKLKHLAPPKSIRLCKLDEGKVIKQLSSST